MPSTEMFKCSADMWTLHSTQQRLQDASLVQHEPSIQTRCHKQHQYLWSWRATALHNAGKIESSKKSSPAAKRPAVCKSCVKRFRLRLDRRRFQNLWRFLHVESLCPDNSSNAFGGESSDILPKQSCHILHMTHHCVFVPFVFHQTLSASSICATGPRKRLQPLHFLTEIVALPQRCNTTK